MSEREEPAWLSALEITAKNPLMKDQQIIPIINDGTFEAVWNYIAALRTELAAAQSDRDEFAAEGMREVRRKWEARSEVNRLRELLAAAQKNQRVTAGLLDAARDIAHENAERADTAERERDEARREREALKIDHADALDAYRQMYESERDRAERAEQARDAAIREVAAIGKQLGAMQYRAERMARAVREARQLVECNEMAIADSERFDFYLNSLGAELRALDAAQGDG